MQRSLWLGLVAVLLVAGCYRPPSDPPASSCVIRSGETPECACTADDVCIGLHPRVFKEMFGEADGARPTQRQLANLRRGANRNREPLRHEVLSIADACEIAGHRCVLIKQR